MAIYYQVLGFARCPLKFLSHCFPLPALLWYSITWRLVLRYDNLVLIIPCRVLFSAALYQGVIGFYQSTRELTRYLNDVQKEYEIPIRCVLRITQYPPPPQMQNWWGLCMNENYLNVNKDDAYCPEKILHKIMQDLLKILAWSYKIL